jgi:hypothetical protein
MWMKKQQSGWKTPTASECGRVYYDLSGVAKWIRKLFKIRLHPEDSVGEELVEIDYSAFHFNLLVAIFGPRMPQKELDRFNELLAGDCHGNLARAIYGELNDDEFEKRRHEIKIENLSFLNKPLWQQKESIIYEYMTTNFKILMNAMTRTKFSNPERTKLKTKKNKKTGKKEKRIVSMAHAETSEILFRSESALMTENLEGLMVARVAAGYAYDALWVPRSKAWLARAVMQFNAGQYGVPTLAK